METGKLLNKVEQIRDEKMEHLNELFNCFENEKIKDEYNFCKK